MQTGAGGVRFGAPATRGTYGLEFADGHIDVRFIADADAHLGVADAMVAIQCLVDRLAKTHRRRLPITSHRKAGSKSYQRSAWGCLLVKFLQSRAATDTGQGQGE